jgi:hypothetical protein
MEKFELYSTCATVTWCGRLIALNNLTRVYVEVNHDKAEISIREPGKAYTTLAIIDLNKDFESISVKSAKSILDFVQQHNEVLVDGYDLDGLAATLQELLRQAGLVDVE